MSANLPERLTVEISEDLAEALLLTCGGGRHDYFTLLGLNASDSTSDQIRDALTSVEHELRPLLRDRELRDEARAFKDALTKVSRRLSTPKGLTDYRQEIEAAPKRAQMAAAKQFDAEARALIGEDGPAPGQIDQLRRRADELGISPALAENLLKRYDASLGAPSPEDNDDSDEAPDFSKKIAVDFPTSPNRIPPAVAPRKPPAAPPPPEFGKLPPKAESGPEDSSWDPERRTDSGELKAIFDDVPEPPPSDEFSFSIGGGGASPSAKPIPASPDSLEQMGLLGSGDLPLEKPSAFGGDFALRATVPSAPEPGSVKPGELTALGTAAFRESARRLSAGTANDFRSKALGHVVLRGVFPAFGLTQEATAANIAEHRPIHSAGGAEGAFGGAAAGGPGASRPEVTARAAAGDEPTVQMDLREVAAKGRALIGDSGRGASDHVADAPTEHAESADQSAGGAFGWLPDSGVAVPADADLPGHDKSGTGAGEYALLGCVVFALVIVLAVIGLVVYFQMYSPSAGTGAAPSATPSAGASSGAAPSSPSSGSTGGSVRRGTAEPNGAIVADSQRPNVLVPFGAGYLGPWYLDAFEIRAHEVTRAEYSDFVQATNHPAPSSWPNGSPEAGSGALPVTNISHDDARLFVSWIAQANGLPSDAYRLPTRYHYEGLMRPRPDLALGAVTNAAAPIAAAAAADDRLDWPEGSVYHLYGNVAEWVETDPAAPGQAAVAGYSYDEDPATLGVAIVRESNPSPSPLIGFRYIKVTTK